jgi:hypothetical protein
MIAIVFRFASASSQKWFRTPQTTKSATDCLPREMKNLILSTTTAQVAELADALGSGPSGSNLVQVRFLSWAIGYAETGYVT